MYIHTYTFMYIIDGIIYGGTCTCVVTVYVLYTQTVPHQSSTGSRCTPVTGHVCVVVVVRVVHHHLLLVLVLL